jgi:RecB family endonuclease NucS
VPKHTPGELVYVPANVVLTKYENKNWNVPKKWHALEKPGFFLVVEANNQNPNGRISVLYDEEIWYVNKLDVVKKEEY